MSLASNKIRSGTLSHPNAPPIKFIGSSASCSSPMSSPRRTIENKNYINSESNYKKRLQHLYVLPVLLLEFLALALTRAVIPSLLLQTFDDSVYFVMGCAECVRGLLAFVACPMFGKISDVVGRKACLFVTVLGTCLPVCTLAVMTWRDYRHVQEGGDYSFASYNYDGVNDSGSEEFSMTHHEYNTYSVRKRMWVFVILLSLSGIFSSTFTLTFAYISDTVKRKKDRVSAYGLALATFGLSFTIGPLAGGYLAHVEEKQQYNDEQEETAALLSYTASVDSEETFDEDIANSSNDSFHEYLHPLGQKRVFTTTLVLTVIDLIYIYFFLPESVPNSNSGIPPSPRRRLTRPNLDDDDDNYEYDEDDENTSVATNDTRASISDQWNYLRQDVLPNAFSPFDTLKVFSGDPFMYEVGCIAFLYYTSLWAVVSTLMLYAVKRFQLSPERLGELMSALGLSTMISEAVLVRMVVPSIGEKKSMRLGLAAFFLQCIVLGFAYEGWHLFICVLISMVGNLVYPSLTSLVSSAVAPEMVGEALGAVNGVKALTEGVGPLVFGTLMTMSEKSLLPGWPYLIASIFAIVAYQRSARLPDDDDEEYISEKYESNNKRDTSSSKNGDGDKDGFLLQFMTKFVPEKHLKKSSSALSKIQRDEIESKEEEYVGLLSEIDELDEEDLVRTNYESESSKNQD